MTSMKCWHSSRSISSCSGGIARSRMQYPSSRYCFLCSSVTTGAVVVLMLMLDLLGVDWLAKALGHYDHEGARRGSQIRWKDFTFETLGRRPFGPAVGIAAKSQLTTHDSKRMFKSQL